MYVYVLMMILIRYYLINCCTSALDITEAISDIYNNVCAELEKCYEVFAFAVISARMH